MTATCSTAAIDLETATVAEGSGGGIHLLVRRQSRRICCVAAPKGKAPMLLDRAMKDPIGVNLDRNQIVKGWVDKHGNVQERVYDVAWSGKRKPGSDGKLPPVGNTVDIAEATWTNTIGAPELIAVWKDPDFDPSLRAFYYGRVIEIPTPRWTAYDVKYFGSKPEPGTPMVQQERAYTSPIWYKP